MGLKNVIRSLFLRPRCSWDLRAVPWTDGVGNKAQFVIDVEDWSPFHDNLPATNRPKITPSNRGVLTITQVYVKARKHCRAVRADLIAADNETILILDAFHKKDGLSGVAKVYCKLQKPLPTQLCNSESYREFEAMSQLCSFIKLGTTFALSEAISGLFFLSNAMSTTRSASLLWQQPFLHPSPRRQALLVTS